MRNISLSFLLLLSLPSLALAAAWTLPADKLEIYNNAFYYSTAEYFDAAGEKQPQRRYSKYTLNPYIEYGLLDGSTLGGSWGMDRVKGSTLVTPGNYLSGLNYGISDPLVFLRQRLWQGDASVISVQPLIKFPSFYRDDLLPQSGSDDFDGELRLLGGHGFSLWGQNHFVNLELAYRKRFGDQGDQFQASFSTGLRFDDRWMLLPEISLVQSISGAQTSFTQSANDNYDLLKPQLSLAYQFSDQMTLQAGLFRHLDGSNTGAGGGAMLSLWYRP